MNDPKTTARVQGLYGLITGQKLGNDPESVQVRVNIIRELERLLRTDFKSTEDFHFKIKSYLTNGKAQGPGKQLRNARRKMKFSQSRLALEFNCSRQFITQMENGNRPLTKEALSLVELTNYPVFNKGLILKQLRETDSQAIPNHAEPDFACQNVVDSKGVLAIKNEGHGYFKSESITRRPSDARQSKGGAHGDDASPELTTDGREK